MKLFVPAGYHVAAAPVGQLGALHGALLRSVAAAGAEGAAGGHIEGAGDGCLEHSAVFLGGRLGGGGEAVAGGVVTGRGVKMKGRVGLSTGGGSVGRW